jgi:hypothetical protein
MNKYELSDRVERLFRDAGWSESRVVDADKTITWLRDKGYGVGVLARDFLTNCLGLKLESADRRTAKIDPVAGLAWLSDESPAYIEALAHEAACPIGHGSQMVILVGVSGRCTLLKDDWLGYEEADNLGEALEKLFFPSEYPVRWQELRDDHRPADL